MQARPNIRRKFVQPFAACLATYSAPFLDAAAGDTAGALRSIARPNLGPSHRGGVALAADHLNRLLSRSAITGLVFLLLVLLLVSPWPVRDLAAKRADAAGAGLAPR
jgi:hypothetical protein